MSKRLSPRSDLGCSSNYNPEIDLMSISNLAIYIGKPRDEDTSI